MAEEVTKPQRNVPTGDYRGDRHHDRALLAANLAYSVVLTQDEMAKISGTSVAAEFASRLLGPNRRADHLDCDRRLGLRGDERRPDGRSAAAVRHGRGQAGAGTPGCDPSSLQDAGHRYDGLGGLDLAMVLIVGLLIQTNVLAMGKNHFDVLTDFAVFGSVLFETMAVASIFMFRWKRPDAERPYRCLGYPWVPLVYVLCFTCVLASYVAPEKQVEAATGLGFTLVGAAVYGIFLRKR